MINLFKSEWYQLTHRKAPLGWLIFGAVTGILPIVLPVFTATMNEEPLSKEVIHSAIIDFYPMMIVMSATILLLGLVNTAFNNELKNRTLINAISYGFPRWMIYMTKFVSATILSMLFVLLSLLFLNMTSLISFGSTIGAGNLEFLALIGASFPIWTAYISIYLLALFLSDTPTPSYITLALLFIVIPIFFQVMSYYVPFIAAIRPYVLTELQSSELGNFLGINLATWIGLAYTIVFLAIGITYFNKKEVK